MNPYKEMIYKMAEEKKKDPFATTKIVGATNLAGIPADMALGTAIELGDIKRTAPKGVSFLKHLATPEVKDRMAQFASKQIHTGLPMAAGLGAILTAPVAAAEYMKYKKDNMNKSASLTREDVLGNNTIPKMVGGAAMLGFLGRHFGGKKGLVPGAFAGATLSALGNISNNEYKRNLHEKEIQAKNNIASNIGYGSNGRQVGRVWVGKNAPGDQDRMAKVLNDWMDANDKEKKRK